MSTSILVGAPVSASGVSASGKTAVGATAPGRPPSAVTVEPVPSQPYRWDARRGPHHREGAERLTDSELLSLHCQGSSFAFSLLVRRHQRLLAQMARRHSPCDEDAADSLQEALVSACRYTRGFRGEASVKTWLVRIVINACYDTTRAQKRRPAAAWDESLTDRVASQVDIARQTVLSIMLRDALAQLPLEQREVVVLLNVQGFSIRDTAKRLNIAEGTVKSRASRARVKLAALLQAYAE